MDEPEEAAAAPAAVVPPVEASPPPDDEDEDFDIERLEAEFHKQAMFESAEPDQPPPRPPVEEAPYVPTLTRAEPEVVVPTPPWQPSIAAVPTTEPPTAPEAPTPPAVPPVVTATPPVVEKPAAPASPPSAEKAPPKADEAIAPPPKNWAEMASRSAAKPGGAQLKGFSVAAPSRTTPLEKGKGKDGQREYKMWLSNIPMSQTFDETTMCTILNNHLDAYDCDGSVLEVVARKEPADPAQSRDHRIVIVSSYAAASMLIDLSTKNELFYFGDNDRYQIKIDLAKSETGKDGGKSRKGKGDGKGEKGEGKGWGAYSSWGNGKDSSKDAGKDNNKGKGKGGKSKGYGPGRGTQ